MNQTKNTHVIFKRKPATLKNFKLIGYQQKWNCKICRKMLTSTCQIDHKLPLCKGGNNDISNLQILCLECHALKTRIDTIPTEMKKCISCQIM